MDLTVTEVNLVKEFRIAFLTLFVIIFALYIPISKSSLKKKKMLLSILTAIGGIIATVLIVINLLS